MNSLLASYKNSLLASLKSSLLASHKSSLSASHKSSLLAVWLTIYLVGGAIAIAIAIAVGFARIAIAIAIAVGFARTCRVVTGHHPRGSAPAAPFLGQIRAPRLGLHRIRFAHKNQPVGPFHMNMPGPNAHIQLMCRKGHVGVLPMEVPGE